MGGSSSRFSKKYVLHFHKPDENRLYLFDTNYERLYCYPVYKDYKPFFFGGLETINIPKRQCIFLIGGLQIKDKAKYIFIKPRKPEDGAFDNTNTPRLRGNFLFYCFF